MKSFDAEYAEAAKQYLEKNYATKIIIQDLANEIGVGEKTLKRAFKKILRKNIYEYQIELRMEKAIKYLEGDRPMTIQQVAKLVGYRRQSSFNKRFIKHFGVSPSNWEKNGILS